MNAIFFDQNYKNILHFGPIIPGADGVKQGFLLGLVLRPHEVLAISSSFDLYKTGIQ